MQFKIYIMVKQSHAIKCYFCIAENSFTYIFVSYRIYMLYGHWIPIENIVKIYIYKYIFLFVLYICIQYFLSASSHTVYCYN